MLKYLLNLFFPLVCSGCNSFLLTNEKVICTLCRHHIPLTNHHLNPENEAFKKFYGRIPGSVLGNWYAEDLKEKTTVKTADIIIPVPLHKKKLRERGYNQVTTFGLALSKELDIPYNDSLLFRTTYSKTQSKKNRLDRSEGIDAVFDVCFNDRDHDKHYLLVDDVITTGATLEACSRALLKIPGAKVSIVCMALAQS
jgi:ComF family protein